MADQQEEPVAQKGGNWADPRTWNRNTQIGVGVGALAALGGIAALGIYEYKQHQAATEEHMNQQGWSAQNWTAEASQRKQMLDQAVSQGQQLPNVYWVLCEGGAVPPNAIAAGQQSSGEALYVGRAYYENTVQVGKVAPHLGGCQITFKGKVITINSYEVIVGNAAHIKWCDEEGEVEETKGYNPIDGGREENGAPIFVAQAFYQGSVYPAKAGPQLKGAFIAHETHEVLVKNFRLLTLC